MIKDFETYINEGRMGRLVNADDSVRKQDELTEEEVRSYLDDYRNKNCKNITIRYEAGSRKPIVDIDGSYIFINLDIETIPFKFGVVTGDFYIVNCENLTSLEGCPKEVGGNFSCSGCKKLTSLAGCPQIVGGYFSCENCSKLTSLVGCPEKINGMFSCENCNSLTSLEGSPKEVGYKFDCKSCKKLISLEGGPEKVVDEFTCYGCKKLTSLEGCPKEAGIFSCENCGKKFTIYMVKKLCNVTKRGGIIV